MSDTPRTESAKATFFLTNGTTVYACDPEEMEKLEKENQRLKEENKSEALRMADKDDCIAKLIAVSHKLAEVARTIGWTSAEDTKTLRMAEAALAEFDNLTSKDGPFKKGQGERARRAGENKHMNHHEEDYALIRKQFIEGDHLSVIRLWRGRKLRISIEANGEALYHTPDSERYHQDLYDFDDVFPTDEYP